MAWTLVDTGMSSRKTKAIWAALIAGPLAGKPVRRLIVTHHHPDHIGLAGWFQAQGVELITTRTAWLYARMLVLDEQPKPTPEAHAVLPTRRGRCRLCAPRRPRNARSTSPMWWTRCRKASPALTRVTF